MKCGVKTANSGDFRYFYFLSFLLSPGLKRRKRKQVIYGCNETASLFLLPPWVDFINICAKLFQGFLNIFGVPYLATYSFFIIVNEPGLGTRIDPGMALTSFPSIAG